MAKPSWILENPEEARALMKERSPVQRALDACGWTVDDQIKRDLELQKAKMVKTFCHKGAIIVSEPMEDNATQVKAADQMNKIMGLYSPDRHEVKEVEDFTLNIITGRGEEENPEENTEEQAATEQVGNAEPNEQV